MSSVEKTTADRCRIGNGHMRDRKMRPSEFWSRSSMATTLRGLLSILAGYYEKKLCRNINAQNSWLYVSGIAFNVVATVIQDFDAVARDPSMVLIHHNNHES
ncbi:hypothetical protein Bca4012_030856 [Brassica carinata]